MIKKFLGLLIAAVMMIGVFGLTACNNDTLDAYKTEGKAAIETYAQERRNSYSDDNWAVVCGIVETGKENVDAATTKPQIDTAVEKAKEGMDDLKIQVKQGVYSTDDNWATITLYGDNQFTFSVMIISSLPMGNYSIKNGKLVLSHSDNYEAIFNIADGQLVFVGSTENGVFVDDGIVQVGTVFKLAVEEEIQLKQGYYKTENGMVGVYLHGENEFSLEVMIMSYLSTGTYLVNDGSLILNYMPSGNLVFKIGNNELIYLGFDDGSQLGEGWSSLSIGTVLKLIENN